MATHAASHAAVRSDRDTSAGSRVPPWRGVYWRAPGQEANRPTQPVGGESTCRRSCAVFVAALLRSRSSRAARLCASRATHPGADVSGRSALAEAAAESLDSRLDHRRGGRRAGSHLGRPSRRRFARPRGPRWASARTRRPPSTAARPRRRAASSMRRATLLEPLGRPGHGYDWPRTPGGHRRRCEGTRLDHGGRRRPTPRGAAGRGGAGRRRSTARRPVRTTRTC